MGDQELRRAVRADDAGGDPAAREARVRAELRDHGPAAVEADDLERALRFELQMCQDELGRLAPRLGLDDLVPALREVLAEGEAEPRHAWARLAKVRPGRFVPDPVDPGEILTPIAAFVFAVRSAGKVTVSVRSVEDAKDPTPGTTWRELSPWRDDLRADGLRRRLEAWLARRDDDKYTASVLAVEVLVARHATPAPVIPDGVSRPARDPSTDKQLAFVQRLAREQGLEPGALAAIAREANLPGEPAAMTSAQASALITRLLERGDDETGAAPLATAQQVALLGRLQRRCKLNASEWAALLEDQAGVVDVAQVGKRRASSLIDLLQSEVKRHPVLEKARRTALLAKVEAATERAAAPRSKRKAPAKEDAPADAPVAKAPPAARRGKKRAVKEAWKDLPGPW